MNEAPRSPAGRDLRFATTPVGRISVSLRPRLAGSSLRYDKLQGITAKANKKGHHPIYHLVKKYDSMSLFKPA